MPIALLATGDELVVGDTLNTNGQQLAHTLHSEGLILGTHLICSDNESEIVRSLTFLATHHDIVIITGGLGPTSDDRTRFALAKFMNVTLQEYPAAKKHIEQRLQTAKLPMTKANQQQALFPAETRLLANPFGTAMGGFIQWNNIQIVLLPGPPRECLPMFNTYVLPALSQTQHANTTILKWRLFGTAEGQIAQQLDEALANIPCETGYRLEMPYLEFKVRCKKEFIESVKTIIEPLIKPHLIATPEKRASEQLADYLAEKKIFLSIVDNATGGTLQTLIQRPNNYQFLSFYKKENADIYCEINGLQTYWDLKAPQGELTLDVKWCYQGKEKKIHQKHYKLPHRSSLVLQHAAEWLSFCIFHLINTIH